MRNLKVLSICGRQHFKRELQRLDMTLSNLLAQKTNLRLFCRLGNSYHSSSLFFAVCIYTCLSIHSWLLSSWSAGQLSNKIQRLPLYLHSPFLVVSCCQYSVQLCFFFGRSCIWYCTVPLCNKSE